MQSGPVLFIFIVQEICLCLHFATFLYSMQAYNKETHYTQKSEDSQRARRNEMLRVTCRTHSSPQLRARDLAIGPEGTRTRYTHYPGSTVTMNRNSKDVLLILILQNVFGTRDTRNSDCKTSSLFSEIYAQLCPNGTLFSIECTTFDQPLHH